MNTASETMKHITNILQELYNLQKNID